MTTENLQAITDQYPLFVIRNNTPLLFESIGALKTLRQYFPALDAHGEITNEITSRLQFAHEWLHLNETIWNRIPAYENLTIKQFFDFVNDAESHGYEFKVQNGVVFYRMRQNDEPQDIGANKYQE